MVQVRRDPPSWRVWGSIPPHKQNHLEWVTQDHIQTAFEYLQGGRPHLLWVTCASAHSPSQ